MISIVKAIFDNKALRTCSCGWASRHMDKYNLTATVALISHNSESTIVCMSGFAKCHIGMEENPNQLHDLMGVQPSINSPTLFATE